MYVKHYRHGLVLACILMASVSKGYPYSSGTGDGWGKITTFNSDRRLVSSMNNRFDQITDRWRIIVTMSNFFTLEHFFSSQFSKQTYQVTAAQGSKLTL